MKSPAVQLEEMLKLPPEELGKLFAAYVQEGINSEWSGYSESEIRAVMVFLDDMTFYYPLMTKEQES